MDKITVCNETLDLDKLAKEFAKQYSGSSEPQKLTEEALNDFSRQPIERLVAGELVFWAKNREREDDSQRYVSLHMPQDKKTRDELLIKVLLRAAF